MFYYDLTLNAWVRKPGSKSPPEMTPVLCLGGVFDFNVTFCDGARIENPAASAWIGGIKMAGNPTGEYVASDTDPEVDGTEAMRFMFDLTGTENPAAVHFAANPTLATAIAVIQIGFTDAFGIERRTTPLQIVLQNDYLQTS